jgi:transposase-like protein
VLGAMMERDRTALCGPKWTPNAKRSGYRHGTTPGAITLGARRIRIERPRARSVDAATELELPSFRFAADRDPLDERTMEAIAVGVSSRKYARSLEPLPPTEVERVVSRSSVSRRFVALSTQFMRQWLSADVSAIGIVAILIDGITFRGHTILIALGVASDGLKHVLGLREGSTENATVAKALLADLVERGLPTDRPMLFVIDGGKGIHKAVIDVFGELAAIQRCQVHKKRNVKAHVPEKHHAELERRLSEAYHQTGYEAAKASLEATARWLGRINPDAASSLREALEETLAVVRLGLAGALRRTLATTNPIESALSVTRRVTARVTRWRDGEMRRRWCAAGLLRAESKFRRVKGHRALPTLIKALEESTRARRSGIERGGA